MRIGRSYQPGALVARLADADVELTRLVAAITPVNRHEGTDWGEARGAEAW